MRLLILSDIHANIAALRAIEKDAGAVDAIYCAGDYVDYGTDPHEAIGWVREHGAHCVMGNHDRHLLNILFSGVSGNKSLQMGARQLRTGDG